MPLCVSVYMCLVVSSAGKGLTFPIGILGQVGYLIVSIPDLCTLTYSADNCSCSFISHLQLRVAMQNFSLH